MIKTVAITGATGTLGRATVTQFHEANWHVRGASLHGGPLLSQPASDIPVRKVDITIEAGMWGVEKWLESVAPINALVTCAGVSLVKPSLEMTADEWRHVIDVNLTGTFLSIREAVKVGATRIVTIGSIHGCTPTSYPQRAAYTASKAGVVGLTQALAVELAPQGVAVNCVAPGHLPVLMDGTGAGSELLEAARARTPTGKLTTAQEIAEVVYWLCDAPLNLTGQIVTVDGGFTLNTWPMRG